MANFAQALTTARRKARVAGKPLTTQETAGITEGFAAESANVASTNLAIKSRAEELAETRQIQREQAKRTEKLTKKEGRGAAVGALAGGIAGALIPIPGVGAAMGSLLGTSLGSTVGEAVGGGCIIVTTCTSEDSPEVNLTREYRDKFLTREQIMGYYWLASMLVPFISRFGLAKIIIKKLLVDRLIDHGGVALGRKEKHEHRTSYFVSEKFLHLCSFLGFFKSELTKSEVTE